MTAHRGHYERPTETDCRCANSTVECPEGQAVGDRFVCAYCASLDMYDPCPVRGFGCGSTPGSVCDCCTPEQREAAAR